MTDSSDIILGTPWNDPTEYIELYGVKSGRHQSSGKRKDCFNVFAKFMYLSEEVYSQVTISDPHDPLDLPNVTYYICPSSKSLAKAEQDLALTGSLEELAVLLATSPFPYSRDIALVAFFCSMKSFELGIHKPEIREWLCKLSHDDPAALSLAFQDPDFPKLVRLLEGRLFSNSF